MAGLARNAGHIARAALRAAPAHLATYVVFTVVAGAVPVASAWLMKLLIDGLIGQARPGRLLAFAAALAAATVLAAVLPQAQQYLHKELGRRVTLSTQDRLFTALDRQIGLRRFENPRFHDRLMLAQQAGRSSPHEVLGGAVGLGQGAVTVVGLVGSLLVISPVMTGVVLAAGVPALLAELALSRRRAQLALDLGHAERREFFYARLLTDTAAAKEIRLFRMGRFLRGRMLGELRHIHRGQRGMDRRELGTQAALMLLSAAVAGAGLAWAVVAASGGRLSAGDLTLFIAAVAGVQGALAGVIDQAARVYHALLLFGHWADIVRAGPDLPVPARPRAVPPLRRGIELRDVWFRYSDAHPWVLKGVQLTIPFGQSVAIVGHNGEGKSTLVKLLCRLYDPDRGAVLWDGIDLRDLDPGALRDRIGAVFQDYMAYDMTAAENIAIGDLAALGDTERIVRGARFAGVHETLAGLPRGYDTPLTRAYFSEADREDDTAGVMLSGGQWQRVALARAMLRGDRDLLILDEPSSGLDAEAEHEIHARLRAHRRGRTSVLISHRLGTIRDAHSIVVLADGTIAEQGTHENLMAAEGRYARLFGLQAAGYQHAH